MTFVKFKNNGQLTNAMLDKMFSPMYQDFFSHPVMDSTTVLPAVNVLENDEQFRIELAAPGLTKESFNIKIEKDVLTISTEKKTENIEEGTKFTRKEFAYHSFKRSFNLPEIADQENISAEYKDGILHVTILKQKAKLPAVKEIKIS